MHASNQQFIPALVPDITTPCSQAPRNAASLTLLDMARSSARRGPFPSLTRRSQALTEDSRWDWRCGAAAVGSAWRGR